MRTVLGLLWGAPIGCGESRRVPACERRLLPA
jgi:hypothetical protein